MTWRTAETSQSYFEAQRVAARMKSYTGPAILVFILYWLFYLPGFIANYIYYQEAKCMEHIAGHKLPGAGCLASMLWINVASIIVILVLALLAACAFLALPLFGAGAS